MDIVPQVFDDSEKSEKQGKVRTSDDIIVKKYVRRFEIYKDILATKLYRPQWLINYKLWRSYMDSTTYPHRSKLFIPLTFQYIETVLPRVASNKVTIAVSARRTRDNQYVEQLNQVMAWNISRNQLNTKWPTFARQLVIHGFSVAYAFWNTDPLTGFPYGDFETIDLFNFYVDPRAYARLDQAPEAIIRVSTVLGTLRAKEKLGLYDKGLVDKVAETSAPTSEMPEPVVERHQAIGAGFQSESDSDPWKKVELLLHITPNKTTVIANRSVILRTQDNFGTSPLVGCSWTEDLFHMFGIGQVEPAQGLQHAVNGTSNMMFDARSLALRGVTLVGTANATVEDSKFQRKAGSIIRVTDVQQVRNMSPDDVSGGVGEERMFYMGQMQETHSAMDIVRGASGADETATQAQINNAAIETKLSFPTKKMEEAIKQLGMIWHGMLGRFMPQQTLTALGFEDNTFPQGITPEAFAAQVNFIPIIEPEAPLTKQFKRRNMQEAIGGLLSMPGFPELMLNDPALQSRIYTIGIRHFDLDEGQDLISSINKALENKMQEMAAPPPPPPPPDPGMMPPEGMPPEQMQPPPLEQAPMESETMGPDIGSLINQMSDEEIAQLMTAPPEQMAQVLFAMSQSQMGQRPPDMPAMMPSVTAQGVM